MQSPLCKVAPTNGQASDTKVTVVTGQYIARATVNYPSRQRAEDAVRWFRGELTIKPTLKLAAETFGISIPLVMEARRHLAQVERLRRLHQTDNDGGGTTALSDSAVENIVAEVGVERIWRAVDKLTQPPLAAAE